ncbi:MAG: recombination mediator RecR [Candidatus Omnitrophica bacterium]|nr:recombination mediator RecR [Candidatus Omnitrophota bacterium]
MGLYPKIVEALIAKLRKLPGVGPRSAERIVNFLLAQPENEVITLAENIKAVKHQVRLCQRCFNLTEETLCSICQDNNRKNLLCVVEQVKDLVVLEKAGFPGVYHVLGGSLSPLEQVGPEEIRVAPLVERLKQEKFEEVIIATNPTQEGENTAAYLSRILKTMGIKHSRIACGLPVGGEIEYADIQTLKKSLEGRKTL